MYYFNTCKITSQDRETFFFVLPTRRWRSSIFLSNENVHLKKFTVVIECMCYELNEERKVSLLLLLLLLPWVEIKYKYRKGFFFTIW